MPGLRRSSGLFFLVGARNGRFVLGSFREVRSGSFSLLLPSLRKLETLGIWQKGSRTFPKLTNFPGPFINMARKRYVSSIPKFLRRRASGQRVKHYPRRPKPALAALLRRALFERQRKKTHAWARDFKKWRKTTLTAKYHRERIARRKKAIRAASRRRR